MTKYMFSSALAALALGAPVAASAQALPGAIIAIVDRDRIAQSCGQCTVASQALQAQGQQYQQREQQLLTPLQTEGNAIQALINALPAGGQPDPALRTRIQTFQTNQQAAERDLTQRQQALRANQQYVITQVLQRMDPLIQQVTQQRGANVALDVSATLAHGTALDVTDAVLALMNQNSAPFITTAPPPAATPTATPTRPAATPTPTPTRPRPQGR
jgi:Skp family chaperone for outer membrane proteins